MSFLDAVIKCFRKYASFNGRASRSEYWWFTLAVLLVEWPLALTTFGGGWFTHMLSFIYFTLTLVVLVPHMAVWTRRMHDVNKRGWSWMNLRRLTKQGDLDDNRFGPPDNSAKVDKRKPANGNDTLNTTESENSDVNEKVSAN